MKKSIRLLSFLLALTMIFSATVAWAAPTTVVEENTESEEGAEGEKAPETLVTITTNADATAKVYTLADYSLVCENKTLALYLHEKNADFAVVRKSNGEVWYSNPPERERDGAVGVAKMDLQSQLLINTLNTSGVLESPNTWTGSVRNGNFKIEKKPNGYRITYNFKKYHITIPMDVLLGDNYLDVSVPVNEVVSDPNAKKPSTLISLSLLPYFGAGSSADEGYLLLPDGSGSLMRFNNHKNNYDIYYQDFFGTDQNYVTNIYRLSMENASLPVYGIKKNQQAILGVLTDGASCARLNAFPAGKKTSYTNAYPEFTIRGDDTVTLNGQNVKVYYEGKPMEDKLSVRYYLIDPAQPDYSGMAQVYRQHLVKEEGMTRQEKVSDSAFVLSLLGAANRTEHPFGISRAVTKPFTTYKQAVEILGALKKKGVSDVVLSYDYALENDVNRKRTSGPKLLAALGGKSGYRALTDYTEKNNIPVFITTDLVRHYDSGIGQIINSVKTLFSASVVRRPYTLSTQYQNTSATSWGFLKASKLGKYLTKFIGKTTKKNQVTGLGLKTMGNVLYSDYGESASRGKLIDLFTGHLKTASGLKYGVLTEKANAYALPYSSVVLDVPGGSSGFDVCDESVPFYQMVLKGYIPFSIESMNQSPSPEEQLLRALETGSLIHYTWAYGNINILKTTELNNYFSVSYEQWLSQAAENYKTFRQVEDVVGGAAIARHDKLAEGVYATSYENGVKVFVNYNQTPAVLDAFGMTIPAKGYQLLKGGDAQ